MSAKLLSYLACFWVSAHSSHGLSRRTAVLLSALVMATSIANALPAFHLLRVTSPGRRPVVLPKIPCFSSSGESRPSDAKLSIRLRRVLCRMMVSPFVVQQVAWSPNMLMVCLHKGRGSLHSTTGLRGDKPRRCGRLLVSEVCRAVFLRRDCCVEHNAEGLRRCASRSLGAVLTR